MIIIKGVLLKRILFVFIIVCLNGCTSTMNININKDNNLSQNSFEDVWNKVASDPYIKLPQNKVSFWKLFSWDKNIILESSQRTLTNYADILEPFEKLAHPNGICFKGLWEIDTKSRYSGYFKNNTKALIIARASSAMSNTKRGEVRAFGFAGKIFPTLNPSEINNENTANFFLIDDLGGTLSKHFTDVALSNEPKVTITMEVLKNLLYGLKITSAFSNADENPGIRQVYEISHLGERNNTKIITPKWMKIEAKKGQTVDAEDFRDELAIKEGKELIFSIFVASKIIDKKKDWQKIGTITLDTSIVSKSCDHQLHFHHPKWKSDLRH